jgi:hypothetical protein
MSGGLSINGAEQIVTNAIHRWRASISYTLGQDDQIRKARGAIAGLDGKAGTLYIGPCDGRLANWPIGTLGARLTPHSLYNNILDWDTYGTPPVTGDALLVATTTSSVSIGSTSVGINVTKGSPLQVGQYFGLGDRLFIITVASNPVQFRPPSREAFSSGTSVKLWRPRTKMRLLDDDTSAMDVQLHRGSLTLNLIEIA